MTAGARSQRPEPPRHNATSKRWFEHSSGTRVNTDAVAVEAIRAEYPQLHLSVVPGTSCNLLSYAAAGHAAITPIDKAQDRLSWRLFLPPATRLGGGSGGLLDIVKFGKFLLDWQGKEYVMYVVSSSLVHCIKPRFGADIACACHRSMDEMEQKPTLSLSTSTFSRQQ